MLSFKQFIKEDIEPQTIPSEWKNKTPRGMEEHDEVGFQLDGHENGDVQWHPDVVQALKHLVKKRAKSKLTESEDYRGIHTSPGPDSGAPLHDVSSNGVYPSDFYSQKGFSYYSDYGNDYDRENHNKIIRYRNQPDKKVWIHRAIPKKVHKKAMKTENPIGNMIRSGDWVTISKEYAKDHGEANLNGDYKIASKLVPARHIYTNGDSHLEWGYHPD